MAKSIETSHARCRFRRMDSCEVRFSYRFLSSPACTSRMRFTHRSKLAALLMMTSSAIYAASRAHIVENAAALLVETRIGGKHACLKLFTPDVVPAEQAFPGGSHLHAQDRRGRMPND